MMTIVTATAMHEVDAVRILLREYQRALDVDLAYQHFDAELRALPGVYGPPRGCLLIAREDEVPIGCVALRDVGGGRAEMKRLYVRENGRGKGVAKQLVIALLEQAQHIGYEEVVLDSLPSMHVAQRLYEQLGFREIPPYAVSPIAGTRYFGCRVGAGR